MKISVMRQILTSSYYLVCIYLLWSCFVLYDIHMFIHFRKNILPVTKNKKKKVKANVIHEAFCIKS